MNESDLTGQEAAVRRVWPGAGAELRALFAGGLNAAAVTLDDLCTVRDWLETAGRLEREPLAAALACLFAALAEGSLCIELSPAPLAERLHDWCGAAGRDWAERIVADLEQPTPNLIGADAEQPAPVVLHRADRRRWLYFQKLLRAERRLLHGLGERLTTPPAEDPRSAAIIDDVVTRHPLRLGERPMVLDGDQRAALELALARPLAVISGGPGTGKTSIVVTLLRCLVRGGVEAERIALAAPTGRAAQRLTDAVRAGRASIAAPAPAVDDALQDVTAVTLHRLLSYAPHLNVFRRHEENRIEADVVIVDEASMISLEMWARLLQAVPPRAKLVVLGDKDQLPSVEAGAVLTHLAPHDGARRDYLALLRVNHRSQPAIREAAEAVNAQDPMVIERLPRIAASGPVWGELASAGGCWLMPQSRGSEAELGRLLEEWARHCFADAVAEDDFIPLARACELTGADVEPPAVAAQLIPLFGHLERRRLLTMLRDGPWGCAAINAFYAERLRPRVGGAAWGRLFVGAPVLVTRNDPLRGLYNGDVGVTLRGRGGLRVAFARQGGFASFPADSLPPHELGFALTVHKSQGSEYDEVLVVLPPRGGERLLTKELLYTALTRAKKLAVLNATEAALRSAIGRRVRRDAALLPGLSGGA
jgi:exodeoxyribonuclease V alpha subunit